MQNILITLNVNSIALVGKDFQCHMHFLQYNQKVSHTPHKSGNAADICGIGKIFCEAYLCN